MPKGKRTSVYFDHETLQFVGLTDAVKKSLSRTYKGVDVDAELSKMVHWLTNSPKGKTSKGDMRLINYWLTDRQVKLAVNPVSTTSSDHSPPIPPALDGLIQDYLEGLWCHCQHILEFNTIRL